MPYVPDKLVSPVNTPVLAYITNTAEDWKPKGRGKYAQKKVDETWSRIKAELQNKRRIGRAHRHSLFNRLCADKIKGSAGELQENKHVFITGMTVEFTPVDERLNFFPPHPTGFDPFSNLARAPEEIAGNVQIYCGEFVKKHGSEPKLKHVFWPVGPYLFPYKFVKEERVLVRHLFPELFEEVKKQMDESGHRTYDKYEKGIDDNEPQFGNFEWSELLVSTKSAKRAHIGIIPAKGYDLRFVYNAIPFVQDADVREKLSRYKEDHALKGDFARQSRVLPAELAKVFPYDEVIDWSTFYNKHIIADFLEDKVILPLKLHRLETVAEKTKYVSDVFNFYRKKYEVGWWNVFANSDLPREGIADKSAQNRIIGVMWGDWLAWNSK